MNDDRSVVMVGVSKAMREMESEIRDAALSNAKVLITGESGVGKEIVARLIHRQSARARAPLVTINCAGVPDSIAESEMFGHMRGSFTDAHRDKIGWLEQAHRGTLFMDEIGEMSLRMQAMLLRFLETGEIQRVGSDSRPTHLDVRVITATHRPLLAHVADKSFREDLYYRLNVVHIAVPPLRDRPEDIPSLTTYFARHFSQTHRMPEPELTSEALACLTAYQWPGNVRELKNIVERLVLRSSNGPIEASALPAELRGGRTPSAPARLPAAPPAGRGGSSLPGDDHALGEAMFARMVQGRESFWSVVYEPFMARDITRKDVREVVRLGLQHTMGNYKMLVASFNMPGDDYKRFLSFLRKYECHVPFQMFRTIATPPRTGLSGAIAE
jgi:DNA-binding NtrC family response regulator